MPNLGVGELLIILLALVLLFGAKKLPDMARGLGRSLRIFKAETSKLRDDDDDDVQHTAQQAPAAQAQAQPVQPLPAPAPGLSAEEQARQLEEQAARLRASAAQSDNKHA
ncbi:Sec-independent protein translocase subunit TatA [Nonomuraea sp. NPDC049309]|jgi:sec-independent protein translocase protein TatA|uniref:Sec-independent protein translocase subunit TatA n=1 Tax=Nonomuraea sp. NPDC049309 TaxID=3364350 RepID=UPI00371B4C0F